MISKFSKFSESEVRNQCFFLCIKIKGGGSSYLMLQKGTFNVPESWGYGRLAEVSSCLGIAVQQPRPQFPPIALICPQNISMVASPPNCALPQRIHNGIKSGPEYFPQVGGILKIQMIYICADLA